MPGATGTGNARAGDRLRRRGALRRRQRVAPREGCGAERGFRLIAVSVRSDIGKSAEPRWPSECDPGNLHK